MFNCCFPSRTVSNSSEESLAEIMGCEKNACQWAGCGKQFMTAEELLTHVTIDHIHLGSKAPKVMQGANGDAASPYLCEPITPEVKSVTKESPMRHRMEDLVLRAQAQIVRALEKIDGGKFLVDKWDRPEGGGGVTAIIQDSTVFEKAGVAVSAVHGSLPPQAVAQMRSRGKDLGTDNVQFFACGVSLVIHGRNPHVPTAHANYRYFEIPNPDDLSQPKMWWYGGGADLTPMYLVDDDAKHFHKVLKDGCDLHDATYYPKFKKWCDEYFYLTHRKEARGVGGIFFDDLDQKPMEELFAFVSDMAMRFVPAYCPVVERNKDKTYTPEQKHWQQLRRGRYVEFNLVIDRGTKFGLAAPGARIESILMSLPLTSRWEYMYTPASSSPEAALVEVLKNPKEWV